MDEEMTKRLRARGCMAMCESFDCGPGWFTLLDELAYQIDAHVTTRRNFRAHQLRQKRKHPNDIEPIEYVQKLSVSYVKEKFGGLRIFYIGGDEITDKLIQLVEALSERTCDVCGAPGKVSGQRWLAARCSAHQV